MMKRLALGAARGTSGAVALRQVCRAGSCPWQCCSPCALRQRSPPATRKLSPVIQAEASEARNAAHGDARPSCRTMLCTTCSAASRLLAGLTTTDARAPPAPWRSLHRSFEGAGHDGAAPFELLHELSPVSSIGIFWLCAAPCLWLQPSAQMPGRAARSDRVRVPSSRGRTGSLLEAAGLVVSSATYRGGAAISRDTLRRRQRNTTDAARRCVRQPLSADLAIQHAASPVASAPFMTASAAVEAAAACP